MKVQSLLIATALSVPMLYCGSPEALAAPKGAGVPHTATGTKSGGGNVAMQTATPTNPLEHNNRGVEFGSKGMWRQAVQEHEEALQGDPWNLTFRRNLSAACLHFGQELLTRKDYRSAISNLRLAIYADPDNRVADESLSAALQATGKDANDIGVRRDEAERLDSEGNYVEAIAEYRHYVRMNDSGMAHYGLGCVLVKQGETVPFKRVEGYKELRTALTKNWQTNEKPDLSRCHTMLADILWDTAKIAHERGNSEAALKRLTNAGTEYRRAVTINPLNSDAIHGLIEVSRQAVAVNPSFNNHLMLAGAYLLQSDFEQAKQEYDTLQELAAQSKQRDYTSVLARARRSFHLAVVSSTQATEPLRASSMKKIEDQLRTSPNDAELLYIYGRGKEQLGDKEAAIRAYEAAAALNENIHPQLLLRLIALGGHAPNRSAAATQAEPAKSVAPPPAAPNDYSRAQSLMAAGKLDEAVTELTAFVDKHPGDAHAWLLLGSANETKGDLEAASATYRQAANLGEKEAQPALDRVIALRVKPLLAEADKKMQANNPTAAAAQLRDAIDIAPKDPSVHHKLLDLLRQLGNSADIEREQKRVDEVERSK